VTITDRVSGPIRSLFVQIPLLETDGLQHAKVKTTRTGFTVEYRKFLYSVECLFPSEINVFIEPFTAPNRNGIYKVGCFKAKGNRITYRISVTDIA